MAKATFVKVKPEVKPEVKVMLELSIQEAALLYAITGGISASGEVGAGISSIYTSLKEIPRVSTYGIDIVRHIFKDHWQMYIREPNLPKDNW
jgi:hypothetical protein